MKIEKVNENKLKILLTNDDLKERNIKMSELAFGSEKTRDLFKEMLNLASDEYDFDAEDSQLMIEAIPISLEAIIIVVTKMEEDQKIVLESKKEKSTSLKDFNDEGLSIYEFNNLDDVSLVARTLYGRFVGKSRLLKKDGKYFLILRNSIDFDDETDLQLDIIIGEYGKKRIVNSISQAYLFEHGELIISDNAIDVLGEYL